MCIRDSAQAARLLPEGVAVPLKTLAAAHPSLAAAVERKIQNSKMGETVPELRRLCDGSRLAAGILSLPEEESEALRETLFSSAGADGDEMAELTPEQEDAPVSYTHLNSRRCRGVPLWRSCFQSASACLSIAKPSDSFLP